MPTRLLTGPIGLKSSLISWTMSSIPTPGVGRRASRFWTPPLSVQFSKHGLLPAPLAVLSQLTLKKKTSLRRRAAAGSAAGSAAAAAAENPATTTTAEAAGSSTLGRRHTGVAVAAAEAAAACPQPATGPVLSKTLAAVTTPILAVPTATGTVLPVPTPVDPGFSTSAQPKKAQTSHVGGLTPKSGIISDFARA